jgi:cobalamin biosynthesis protein CobD/CbiB
LALNLMKNGHPVSLIARQSESADRKWERFCASHGVSTASGAAFVAFVAIRRHEFAHLRAAAV